MNVSADTNPSEVHAIAGKLLELIGQYVSCSDEVTVAALKIAATIIEETRAAHIAANLRAGILQQYGRKR